jgi:hypothetical protein
MAAAQNNLDFRRTPSVGWDVACRSRAFLLFFAKDLVANDAAKPDATID